MLQARSNKNPALSFGYVHRLMWFDVMKPCNLNEAGIAIATTADHQYPRRLHGGSRQSCQHLSTNSLFTVSTPSASAVAARYIVAISLYPTITDSACQRQSSSIVVKCSYARKHQAYYNNCQDSNITTRPCWVIIHTVSYSLLLYVVCSIF